VHLEWPHRSHFSQTFARSDDPQSRFFVKLAWHVILTVFKILSGNTCGLIRLKA